MASRAGLPQLAHRGKDKIHEEVSSLRSLHWDASITDLVKQGHTHHALSLYLRVRKDECLKLRSFTYVALLKACSKLKDLENGCQIHHDLRERGLLLDIGNGFIRSTLVDMYAKCGNLTKAREVFDNVQDRDVVIWTSLISGYAEHGYGDDALHSFQQMKADGICPDPVSFVGALKACILLGDITNARDIYTEIVYKGFEPDPFLGSTLVDMYSKCGSLVEAQDVFRMIPNRDVVIWTALISGYVEHGQFHRAMETFEKMKLTGVSPSIVAFVCICKACSNIGCLQKGQEMHYEASIRGHEMNHVIGCTLVDMYAKFGSLQEAQEVFDKLRSRDVVPWTALISGYTEHGHGEEALLCFEHMKLEGIFSDSTIYLSCLKACGSIGAAEKGYEIHLELTKTGWENQLFSSSSLVDMYAKCGSLEEAEVVFGKLLVQDVVSWTALITGYALLGDSEHVFYTIDRMIETGAKPDIITLMSVLNACSQGGLVEKGQLYFETFITNYGLSPTIEHYNCIIDLLCRAGHIDKAIGMTKKMPFHPGIVVWHTILGACRKWSNIELGRYAFERAIQLDDKDVSVYVCMCNIYVDASMEEEAMAIDAMRVRVEYEAQ